MVNRNAIGAGVIDCLISTKLFIETRCISMRTFKVPFFGTLLLSILALNHFRAYFGTKMDTISSLRHNEYFDFCFLYILSYFVLMFLR